MTKKTEILELAKTLQALDEQFTYNKLKFVYTDQGPYRRELYPKHVAFMNAGNQYRFRMFSGGNGTGKSFTGAVELVYHATGLYPDWWKGKRIANPTTIWIVGESGQLFRDSMQKILFGNPGEEVGTGLFPRDTIAKVLPMQGISQGIGGAHIKHVNGHIVSVIVKTFEMRRENLQAATIDLVLFDEEPPLDVYTECIMRLRGTKTKPPGISMLLFTPLKGLSDVVLKYLPDGQMPEGGVHPEDPDKYVCRVDVRECAHLSEADIRAYESESEPHQLEARLSGIPSLGAGRIYPVYEQNIIVKPFVIPDFWPRAYGIDFGWVETAVVWGAKDPSTGDIYLYSEYIKEKTPVVLHALAIKAKGDWINGVGDPAGNNVSISDGRSIIQEYSDHGINLIEGDHSLHAGIARMLNLFETGKLKIFSTMRHTLAELRLYRYDTNYPNIPAKNQDDHALDAIRYLISRFDYVAKSLADVYEQEYASSRYSKRRKGDSITGY